MADINSEFLKNNKRFRTKNKRLYIIFLVFAVLVAVVVFWWLKLVGITVTGDAFCGFDEHYHKDECYDIKFECAYNDESHTHNENCTKKTLICTIPEHIHSSQCFPDTSVDTESENDWLKTFENVTLTDSAADNIVAIALTQSGYKESSNNYIFDSAGNKQGYTRYGEWYGNSYGNWNSMFVAFCLNYAQIEEADNLISINAATMQKKWEEKLLFEYAENYVPSRGDIVFTDGNADNVTDTVAIITDVDEEIPVSYTHLTLPTKSLV